MPLQPFVREALEQMQHNARELLKGQAALVDQKHRTLMMSIEGSTRILLSQYDGYVKVLEEAEAWLEELGYYNTLIPLSSGMVSSLASSCYAMRLLQTTCPLTDQQIQHLEAIERSQNVVADELDRYMHQEWKE